MNIYQINNTKEIQALKACMLKKGLPILQTVAIKGGIARATDLEVMLEMECKAEDGLYKLIDKHLLPAEGSVEDFPEIQFEGETKTYTIDLVKLKDLIPCVSKDKSRPVLMLIKVQDGRAWATDGYKMRWTDGFEGDYYIDPRAVKVMAKFAKTATLEVGAFTARMTAGKYRIYFRQTSGAYPDCKKLIPETPKHYAIVEPCDYFFATEHGADMTANTGEDGYNLRIDKLIPIQACEVGEGAPKPCGVVMPLSNDKGVLVDYSYIKPFGKRVKLYYDIDNPKAPVSVEVIK